MRHNRHILRINPQTLLIRHLDRLLIRSRRRHPRHAPRINIRVKLRRHLEEINHNLRRIGIAIHERQLPVRPLLQIIRVREQRRLVGGVRPGGVGFGEGVRFAGEGGLPGGESAVVGGADGAGGHAELVVGVIPR